MKRQRLLRVVFVMMLAMMLSAVSALATTFYVDATNGNNANSGLSWALAKQTIQAAVNLAASGDNIKIAGGSAADAIYDERVVVTDRTLTFEGQQDNTSTAGPDESSFATIIRPSTNSVSNTEASLLSWSGLPSTSFDAVVYGNFSTNTYSLNIFGLTIDANQMSDGTRLCTGLSIKNGNGTIGDASRRVYVTGARVSGALSGSAYNGGFGIMLFGKSQATVQYTTIDNYQTAGILVAGNSTSTLASTIANQPKPTIQDCIIIGQDRNNASGYITSVLSVQGGRGIMKRTLIYQNYNTANYSAGAERSSYGYGVYLSDARDWTVGSLTLKGDGNLITENEIGVFVELTVAPTIISPGVYQFQKNNIYRNGYNGTTSTSSTGQYLSPCSCSYITTTMGAVRYRNSGTTASSALSMSSNAWGNADASSMFTKSTPAYTPASYDASAVALWQETTGDVISASAPLTPATITYDPSVVPFTAPTTVNFEYGYSQFPVLNDAVAAASAITEMTISVPVGTHVLLEPLVITKKININGAAVCSGTPAGSMATLQLAAGVCGPTVWVQGMSTTATPPDPLNRTPDDVDINDFYVIPRSGGGMSATYNWGFAFTGANNAGLNSPTNTQVKGVKVSSGFSGGLFAMVTDIDVSADGACERISSGPTPSNRDIDAKITYVDDCDITSLTNTDVYDTDDEPGVIARIIFDNTIFVSTCLELQNALDLAASDPSANTPMNIVSITMTNINNNCTANYNVNGGGNVVLQADGVTGIMRFNPNFPININSASSNTGMVPGNEATYPGGTAVACHLVNGSPANVTTSRINIWPPACLQTAVNMITPGNTNVILAASGNGTTSPLAFSEVSGEVTIAKNFDLAGATNVMTAAANATFTGKFVLNAGADVDQFLAGVGGPVTSTRGAAFADGSDQVDLNFTNSALTNYTTFSADAINMALQFVGTSGSRGLKLTQASYAAETPTLNKRVHLHGLASRGSATGTITLNGSGSCANPSRIENVSVAQILVFSNADCIQTALGVAGASQDSEGVGTNSANGSGGTIDLNGVADWTQGMDIGKSVTFINENEGTQANNPAVILRRGANVLAGLTDFTNTVNLTQDASWSTAANPNPQQGVTIVNTGGTVSISGYGRGTAVGTGSAAGGPWAFNNININKSCTVQGFYSATCANNPANCTAADPTVVPPMMTGRGGTSETVIGFNSAGGYDPTGNPIFLIGSSSVTLRGFYFDNVRATADRWVITSNAAGYNTCTVSNNILDGTGGGANQYGFLGMGTAQSRADWQISCNRMFGANSGISNSNNAHFVFWDNNAASSFSATGSDIVGNVVLTDNGFHQVLLINVNNSNSTHMQVTDNFFSKNSGGVYVAGGCVGLKQTILSSLQGAEVLRNVMKLRDAGVYIPLGGAAAAAPNITVANNFITTNNVGVWIEGVQLYTPVLTANEIRINNNFLADNTGSGSSAGVNVLTGVAGTTTGKIDISVNWWGGSANLGPTRGANVTAAVQPFTSANGNQITQNAVGAGDIFTNVLPFYVSGVDQNLTDCGWTGGPLIGPVLRMATGGSALLGIYPTITCARDNSSSGGCSSATIINATRTNTDEIWVIGEGGTGAGATKYPSATSPEPAYPVVFDNTDAGVQPSTVLGINSAIIRHTGTGALQSTTRTNGFTVSTLTFDDQSTGTHTAVDLNSGNATVNACTFNSATASGSYTAIKAQGAGASTVNIGNTTANTITYTGSVGSTGINVVSGFTSGTIARNTITGIFNGTPTSSGGAGIYIGPSNSGITIGGSGVGNTIQGSASNGSNGIVLDATSSTITVNSNSIATTTALRSTNTTGISAGGFGILVYANNGTSAIGNISITNNTIGGTTGTGSVDQAGIFVGGTTGAIGGISIGNSGAGGNTIRGVRDGVGTAAASNAAVAIATFGGTPASGQVDVTWNTIGGTGANEGNKVDLLIGNGTSANNLSVQVQSNNFRDDAQVIDGSDVTVRDNRTAAGTNIRNIFGNPNGTTNTGSVTAGQGQSGNNTFSHAAILTSSTNLQDYASATVRTANAVAIGGVTAIYRRAQTPMSSQTNTDNTVELRENAGMTAATAASYFNESLTFNDCRCMLLGPTTSATNVMTNITSHANIYGGSGSVDLISTGRENKDVRGGITLHAIAGTAGATGATGIYGRIPTGAANKGDVYLQGAAVGADNGIVKFAYHATTLGSQTERTGLGAETTGANTLADRDGGNIIKAGIEDANDDAYAITNNQARRTGVFHRGNGTQFTKPTEGPITGEVTGIFPNPATNEATLRFAVPASGTVAISVYNALGIKVMDFTPEAKATGVYTLDMTTSQLPSGSYTVSISNTVPGFNEPMTITTPLQIVR